MGYLPIFVKVGGHPCIVIGGGIIAESRVRSLLDAGAMVTVVSNEATEGIRSLAIIGKIRHVQRDFQSGDLHGSLIVYVAADDPEVIHSAAEEARALGIPLNVTDNPEASTFISPAILKRGDLQVAISTGGASPAVASLIRQRLERQIGPQYELLLEIMRRARHFVQVREPDQRARSAILKSLAAVLLDLVETLDYQMIDDALRLHLQAGMAELGFEPHDGVISGADAPARDD